MMNKIKSFFKQTNKYFIASFLLIFISIVIKYPTLSTNAEIYAEMGGNFFYNALHKTVIENLWDVNFYIYLMWLPRIITIILVKGFWITNNFPIIAQFIVIALVSFFASILNLNVFRKVISSDKIRFMLSISLGLVADYELYTFIFFAYFGIIFCGLMFFVDQEKLRWPYFIGALVLNFLLLGSKAQYVVLLPVILVFLVYSVIKRHKKSVMFYFTSVVALCFQLFVMIFTRTDWKIKGPPTTILSLFAASISSIMGLLNSYISYVLSFEPLRLYLKDNLNYTDLKNILQIDNLGVYLLIMAISILLLITFAAIIYSLIKLYQKKEKKTLIIFALCNIMAFGCLMLFTMSYFPGSQSVHLITVGKNRAHYFVAFFIYLGVVTLFAKCFETKAITSKLMKVLTIVVLALMFIEPAVSFYTPTIGSDPYSDTTNSYSQWQSYKQLLTYEDYCIPLNPDPWIMNHSCYKLNHEINFTYDVPVKEIDLSKYFDNPERISIRAIIIENNQLDENNNKNNNLTDLKEPQIIALNKNNDELGRAKLLTNRNNKYLYFLFEEKVSPQKIMLMDQNETIQFYPKIRLFGIIKSSKENEQKLSYLDKLIKNPYFEIMRR